MQKTQFLGVFMSLLAGWTMDMWSPIINLFNFIPSYGWMIIVFTIVLKIVLSPLDIWQRKISRDSTMKQQKMQPQLQKLKKQYGNNQQLFNKKQMELYKKEGYNVIGSCVSMLVNMVLTLFIFFTLFSGLSEMSQENTYKQYTNLEEVYKTTFVAEVAKTDPSITEYSQINAKIANSIATDEWKTEAKNALIESGISEPTDVQIKSKAYSLYVNKTYSAELVVAQKAVEDKYEQIKDSWLWVDSIWRPETYVSGVGNYNDFYNIANLKVRFANDSDTLEQISLEYDIVTKNIQQKYSSWNGYFILAILCGFVTYLSFMLTQKTNGMSTQKKVAPVNGNMVDGINKNKQQQQIDPQKSMGIMKFIMPVVMVIFVIFYSTAFALYILANSVMSVLISLCCKKLFEHMDKKKKPKNTTPTVEYSRVK